MANRVKGGSTKPKKEARHEEHELLENPDALRERLSKTESFIENHPTLFLVIGGVLALAIAGFFGYRYYVDNQDAEAQQEMFQAIYYFEADSLSRALNGDGNNYGLLDIIDNYSLTGAANLAKYYAGMAYLKQGNFEEAIDYLSDFSASDGLVQARAYSLIGDAHMELGNYKEAANHYEKAANYKPNKFFSPQYLTKAALAYEQMGDNNSALKAYDKIIEEFPSATDVQQAQKQKMRLEGLVTN
jgi:tetratricopeptide (TPR) repeat protein